MQALAEGGEGAASPRAAATPADVYLWTRPHLAGDLLPSPPDWDYARFREEHLSKYVGMASRFGEEARAAVAGGGGGEEGGGGDWGGGGNRALSE